MMFDSIRVRIIKSGIDIIAETLYDFPLGIANRIGTRELKISHDLIRYCCELLD